MRKFAMLGLLALGLAGCTIHSEQADNSSPAKLDVIASAACHACPKPCEDKSAIDFCRGWYDDMLGGR